MPLDTCSTEFLPNYTNIGVLCMRLNPAPLFSTVPRYWKEIVLCRDGQDQPPGKTERQTGGCKVLSNPIQTLPINISAINHYQLCCDKVNCVQTRSCAGYSNTCRRYHRRFIGSFRDRADFVFTSHTNSSRSHSNMDPIALFQTIYKPYILGFKVKGNYGLQKQESTKKKYH